MQRLTLGANPNNRKIAAIILLAVFVLALVGVAVSQAVSSSAPQAGTSIGNQASASYTDASLISRTATSNTVKTVVAQVYAVALTTDGQSKTAAPGAQVVFPHTLSNKGNGSDSYTLSIANITGNNFDFTSMFIYIDANCDGVADNTTNLNGSTVSLAYGASTCFVAVGVVPSSALAGNVGKFKVTATSVGDGTQTTFNTDTTTATGNAVMAVTKAMSGTSGASPSGPYTVTLTYTNNGNASSSSVKLIDALPSGMTYVAGSGLWSVTGATVLTDATGDTQGTSPTIDYSVTGTTVTAIISSVAPGVSGTVTFKVNIASGVAPGTQANTASYQYNDSVSNVGPFNTNTVNFSVAQTAAVTITGATVASAAQGATVSFTDPVTNNGNGTDTFNITVASPGTFPAGTTFALFKSDGVTPLLDTNTVADGIPDTGPLAAGATYNVIVKATLPSSASGGGPYSVNVTATSSFDSTKTSTAADVLTTITANTVDLTGLNKIGGSSPSPVGVGPGPEASAQDTQSGNPGATLTYVLYVNNTSAQSDTFDLSTTGSLPSGWTLAFRKSAGTDCTTANLSTVITNTGTINGGANMLVCAIVTVPSSAAAGTTAINYHAQSPTTGAADTLHDAATVNTVHSVTFTPNNSGQVFPSGSVTYTHTITNSGNVTETITFVTPTADNQSGWSSTLYQDNGSTPGVLDSTDSAVSGSTTFTLAAGASATMFVKVTAPSGAAIGTVDSTTATALYNSGASSAVATDSSTVIAGQLRLVKQQSLDATCAGNFAGATWTTADITSGAKPGTCVLYQIVATNQGTANVNSAVVNDSTPAYTTYTNFGAASPAATTQGTITAPASGSAGTITATIGTITPLQSVTVTFGVKITP